MLARATDADDPTRFLDRDFTLTLASAMAPSGLAFSASSISAGAIPGTPVGPFSTSDPNGIDAHHYALVAGAGDDDNALFTTDGEWLRVAIPVAPDASQLKVRVRTTDLAGLSYEQPFTLEVTEPSLRVNEVMASNAGSHLDEDGEATD